MEVFLLTSLLALRRGQAGGGGGGGLLEELKGLGELTELREQWELIGARVLQRFGQHNEAREAGEALVKKE